MEIVVPVVAIITAVIGWFKFFLPKFDKTKREFADNQPNVLIERSYIEIRSLQYNAVLKLQNKGRTSAYDVKVWINGLVLEETLSVIHPSTPGFNEYEVKFEISQTSAIRTTKLDDACMKISYNDRWGYKYKIIYPISQTMGNEGQFQISIQTDKAKIERPSVSFYSMRKCLGDLPIVH